MVGRMQARLKQSSRSIALLMFKLFSSFFVGLTLALVVQTLMGIGQVAFVFIILATMGAFVRVSKGWEFTGVIIFNLFCVMTALLLRMYILIAPSH